MAKKTGFEDRLGELEKIVEALEEGDLSLEEAVEYHQKGVKLHRDLRGHLDRMEKRIEELTAGDELVEREGPAGEKDD